MNKKNMDEDKEFIAGPGCSLKRVLDLIGDMIQSHCVK